MSSSSPIRVLLIEDHLADIALTRKALNRLSTSVILDVVLDGMEAMRYLRKQGRFKDVVRPDIILLDLNMPRMDGREVLKAIRAEESLKWIPVVVLTTSSSPSDIRDAYELGANSYIAKPVGYEDFQKVIEVLETYWFNTTLLPR